MSRSPASAAAPAAQASPLRHLALGSSTTIPARGTGTVTVNGTGGTTSGNTDDGVYVTNTGGCGTATGADAAITSSGGNVQVTGERRAAPGADQDELSASTSTTAGK